MYNLWDELRKFSAEKGGGEPKYFVIVDCERVEPLINCANFDDAAERADLCWPNNHTWVSTKDSLRSLRKALNALDI